MLLMRDDDSQLMTCLREEVSLDPAVESEMIPAPPRILVWVVAAVWVLSKRHFIPTCVNHIFFFSSCDRDNSAIILMVQHMV
jgi:hypothetical protein